MVRSTTGNITPKSDPGGKFQFISIQNPTEAKDRTSRRLARAHAVTWALENKRKLQEQSGQNFRIVSTQCLGHRLSARKPRQLQNAVPPPLISAPDAMDAYRMLAADLPGLQSLLISYDEISSLKPAFDVSDELVLQNLTQVLRNEPSNQSLLYAMRLTFASAVTAVNLDGKRLEYKGETLSSLRVDLSSPGMAVSESTLGAILLLAGAEARSGMPTHVQLHMGAIKRLLDTCSKDGIILSDGIKRAIFWQDLNSSVLTGSRRAFDHTTFPELDWGRNPAASESYSLPRGFQKASGLLGFNLVEILKDVHGLQRIRDGDLFDKQDFVLLRTVDNHQASIQSRLMSLPAQSSISDCCRLGAYLCSTMLRCKLWHASVVPPHLSLKLLCRLQETINDPMWNDHLELLTWLLHIGGAFAPAGNTRTTYLELVDLNYHQKLQGLYKSWPELVNILKRFIWSDDAFLAQVQLFWGDVHLQSRRPQPEGTHC